MFQHAGRSEAEVTTESQRTQRKDKIEIKTILLLCVLCDSVVNIFPYSGSRLVPSRRKCDNLTNTSVFPRLDSPDRSPVALVNEEEYPMYSKNRNSARLSLETLETRYTPTTVLTLGHSLWITGTNAADTVNVHNTTIGGVNYVEVTEQAGTGPVTTTKFKMSQLTGGNVFFYGYKGDDHFTNHSTLQVIAYGGEGNDTIVSTTGGYIFGGSGNDVIDCSAAKGLCVLDGGAGNDTIRSGTGTNFLDGGAGDDLLIANSIAVTNYINGGDGNDIIYAGGGINYVHGGDGNDTLYGGTGTNYMSGEGGNDLLVASPSSTLNYMDGGEGNDVLYAGSGRNYLYGGAGNDTLYGGVGTNYLFGGAGTDTLYGGSGNNVLYGGHDGSTDFLIGGTGHNTFRRDFYFDGLSYLDRSRISNYDSSRDTII